MSNNSLTRIRFEPLSIIRRHVKGVFHFPNPTEGPGGKTLGMGKTLLTRQAGMPIFCVAGCPANGSEWKGGRASAPKQAERYNTRFTRLPG